MNCYTGEITQSLEQMKLWQQQGDPVAIFPNEEAAVTARGELLELLGGVVIDSSANREEQRLHAAREFAEKVNRAGTRQGRRAAERRALKELSKR